MNLQGFWILSILNNNNALSRLQGMTVKDIMNAEEFDCKENTIYKHLMQFINKGFVSQGVKDGHSYTYYITESGVDYLRKEKEKV